MEAFDPHPPIWIKSAVHALEFCCPICKAKAREATAVWINRLSPVFTENHRRKWQEFYHCECGAVWWAWSNDRPPTNLGQSETGPDLNHDDPSGFPFDS